MMKILDHYIDQLLDKSTPQAPVWNIEKIKNGGPSLYRNEHKSRYYQK